MFRDKPTAYDRISDTLSDFGDRVADIESRIVERLDPRPSRTERVRRSIENSLPSFGGEPSGISRYVPEFMTGWNAPSRAEARRHIRALKREAESDYEGAVGYLSGMRDRISDIRIPRRRSFQAGRASERALMSARNHRPELTGLLVVGGAVAALGAAYYVTKKVQEHSEEPEYDVVRDEDAVEIRDYDAMIVAETVKSGYHEKARRSGFETLYDYIAAKSRAGKKIAMTTPVIQQLSEGKGKGRGWAIRFVMPKKYTRASLPEPGSDEVEIREVPARRMAAIRFSGNFSASLASKQLMALYNYLADNNLTQRGDPEYAFYNPPWTPGFMKRNEILIEIET